MECPCGTNKTFDNCCKPFIEGHKRPETAEELMRSRYTAFTQTKMDYLLDTHDPKSRDEVDVQGNLQWAKNAQWLGLNVLQVEQGGRDDSTGKVEFIAKFKTKDDSQEHHEIGTFRKRKGIWYYQNGKLKNTQTFVRTEKKVGRNDPCPCQSGKKYKKCCG